MEQFSSTEFVVILSGVGSPGILCILSKVVLYTGVVVVLLPTKSTEGKRNLSTEDRVMKI